MRLKDFVETLSSGGEAGWKHLNDSVETRRSEKRSWKESKKSKREKHFTDLLEARGSQEESWIETTERQE